ncbi:MAG: phytanoyl-CoA dioxygenase family protein [Planctomycetes bacterium]|nr:phytanoyl-CoA dioxygenase family protein [Planctomycetota bacterium]
MQDYELTEAQRDEFARCGWTTLPGFVPEPLLSELEAVYEDLLRRRIAVDGRDYCDMTGDYERPVEDYAILNVMLPRRYHRALGGNVYETRAAAVARALCGEDMELDYDQLVAKPPHKQEAVFHWHQDLGYWPVTPDTRTASFWLALDDVDLDNGCVRFVDGSHRESALRPHVPLLGARGDNHTMVAAVDLERDPIRPARLRRGDATVHHERTLHGSGGNTSDRWRRGYVVAFRSRDTVARERAMGFTHSHNDPPAVLARIAADRRGAEG